LPGRVSMVSLEAQAKLIQAERDKDDSDITDVVFAGTLVEEMLEESCVDPALLAKLVQRFNLTPLLTRSFRHLSTGETRKLMLVQALASHPELLILDEPFEGLDVRAVEILRECLVEQNRSTALLLILNRFDEIPDFVTHMALLHQGALVQQIAANDPPAVAQLAQLLHLQTSDIRIPEMETDVNVAALAPDQPLVEIRNARIAYGDNLVFEHLNWRIEPGQHWQLSGPNGSGKTCLLNLITGDNPQCYNNDIFVFGYQRGQGESIWDIKQHIGYVSSGLQWDYRVSVSVLNVILSGFYDSIGLYQTASDRQQEIARQWLGLLGMSQRAGASFQQLSFGDQRLLLIARAMVKHPPLLILDEPCLGLDDMNRQLVLALIEKVCAETDTTVVYVNHHATDRIEGIDHYLALDQRS
jgi:molybdate transport system ATP-binding protein